ncbi:MAG: 5-dehydro-4-deoxy-D-glucuronate isomerase [Verrucomicrobia bacterium]|nr:5-dehydro-4-deoxy-D-glucuronate isomerase [Verrucomicrobiota bacterium]
MRTVTTADRQHYRRMTSEELRAHFLLEDLFQPGDIELVYTDVDRVVVGGIVPTTAPLTLAGGREMACDFFCERREAGVLNLGAAGTITVDGKPYKLAMRECLYIGRGSRAVTFASDAASTPAQFYLVSCPAHAGFPTTHAALGKANRIELGSANESNRRTIYQYIHQNGIRSCQLVMGFTELHAGSVWNTFPPHTHDRRTEVYCYFDLPTGGLVMHFLGEPDETRHVVMREKQAVLSPPWSIHCACGTGGYRFAWAMGGENQTFDDMDKVDLAVFR